MQPTTFRINHFKLELDDQETDTNTRYACGTYNDVRYEKYGKDVYRMFEIKKCDQHWPFGHSLRLFTEHQFKVKVEEKVK